MTYLEWCDSKGIRAYKHSCTCGGYAHTMNGRDPRQPHMHWCPQYEEYGDLYFQYLGERNEHD